MSREILCEKASFTSVHKCSKIIVQTGFVKNRTIFSNVKKTMEVVANLKKSNKPGAIITIDFEKCFDRIEYKSIRGAFQYLGFGPQFINMMFLLFTNLQMCTASNGYVSRFFHKTRGVNQGCPASPLIFSFCAELMSRLILQNDNIKGITINGVESILSQFADDTAAFLEYNEIVINEFANTLATVEAQMGLKVSYEKTTIYRVGSLHNTNAQFYTQRNFKWSNDDIKLLGMNIPCDGSYSNRNWSDVMDKVRKTCQSWWNRQVTLMGKILIVNVLIGSLFVYKMTTMCDMTKEQIYQVECMIREFIWSGKRPKIAYELLQKDKKDGGLRLVNIKAKQKKIKIGWIFKDLDPFIKSSMYQSLDRNITELIWRCNIHSRDVKPLFPGKDFWTETLEAWATLNFKEKEKVVSRNDIRDQILWYNSNIRINSKPVMWLHWVNKGIFTIGDLCNDRGVRVSAPDLKVNWLEWRSIWEALPKEWVEGVEGYPEGETSKSLYETLSNIKNNRSRYVYNMLIADDEYVEKYRTRWCEEENTNFEKSEYKRAFNDLYGVTNVTKFRNFQYKLLLGKIVTNTKLKQWNIKNSENCLFCHEVETVRHCLFECVYVKSIWDKFFEFCTNLNFEVNSNFEKMVLNKIHNVSNHVINLAALILKQLIYKNRCYGKKTVFEQFVVKLEMFHNVEFANAKVKKRAENHIKKWSPIVSFD